MLQICGDMLTYSRSYSIVLISDIRHILDIDMMKNLSFSCKTDCGDFHKLSDFGKNEFLPKQL